MRLALLPSHRWLRALVAVSIVTMLLVLAWLPIGQASHSPSLLSCRFMGMTGLPCALCGGTRAAQSLLHGDVGRAIHLNALAIPAVALLLAAAGLLAWEAATGRALTDWPARRGTALRLSLWALLFIMLWWIPQMLGALRGSKSELIDLDNPIARALSKNFR